MRNKIAYDIGRGYLAILGIVAFSFGAAEILLSITGKEFEWSILEMSGDFLLWRGLILLFTGLFYMVSIKNFTDIHQQAKAVMASVMIWIIAGMQIFGMILGSIPGGEEGGWFSSGENFLAAYSAPYIPSLFLLPFSLVVIYYIYRLRRSKEREREKHE